MTETWQAAKQLKATLSIVGLSLSILLSSCLPGTRNDTYSYQTDLESLYSAVEEIASNLVATGFDGKNLNITGFSAYTTFVIAFSSAGGSLDVPLTINGVEGGNIELQPRYGGQITSTFTSTANDEATFSFKIRDPNRPRLSRDGGSSYQRRVYDNGFPVVQEIIRRLDARFQRL